MKKTCISHLFGLFFLVLFIADKSSAKQYPELAKLIKEKAYEQAFNLSESMTEAEIGEPEFDFLYGVAARETGHLEAAIFAFERVLFANKNDPRVQYELALTLIKISDYAGAKFALNRVLASSVDNSLKGNATRLLNFADSALAKKSGLFLNFNGVFNTGYNSNVNSSSFEITSTPPGPPIQDGFANLQLAAFILKKITKNDALYFSFASINRKNFSTSVFDFNLLYTQMGFQTQNESFQLKLPYIFEIGVLNYTPALFSNSIGIEIGTNWTKVHEVAISARLKHKLYTNAANNQLLGEFSVLYKGAFLENAFRLKTEFSYRPTFSSGEDGFIGPAVKDVLELLGRANFNLSQFHMLSLEAKFGVSNYSQILPGIDPRKDQDLSTEVGYNWQFSKNLSVGPSYSFVSNFSNRAVHRYARHQIQLGLTASF